MGLTLLTPELSPKRLELLLEILGEASHIAILTNPQNSSHARFTEGTLRAAQSMRIEIQHLRARDPSEIEQAFDQAVNGRAQGVIVFDDPVIWSHRKTVVAAAKKGRLPAMYGYSEFVGDGGLISYGPYRPALYQRTAVYVDKILRGADPALLPVERPVRFELVINRLAAKDMGLAIPPTIMLRADRVIE